MFLPPQGVLADESSAPLMRQAGSRALRLVAAEAGAVAGVVAADAVDAVERDAVSRLACRYCRSCGGTRRGHRSCSFRCTSSSSTNRATGAHFPRSQEPRTPGTSRTPAVAQQTPSTQLPDAHSAFGGAAPTENLAAGPRRVAGRAARASVVGRVLDRRAGADLARLRAALAGAVARGVAADTVDAESARALRGDRARLVRRRRLRRRRRRPACRRRLLARRRPPIHRSTKLRRATGSAAPPMPPPPPRPDAPPPAGFYRKRSIGTGCVTGTHVSALAVLGSPRASARRAGCTRPRAQVRRIRSVTEERHVRTSQSFRVHGSQLTGTRCRRDRRAFRARRCTRTSRYFRPAVRPWISSSCSWSPRGWNRGTVEQRPGQPKTGRLSRVWPPETVTLSLRCHRARRARGKFSACCGARRDSSLSRRS